MTETPKKAHTVKYTSVLPGVGKTHWAIGQIVEHVQQKTGVLLYVAPTTRLMSEVYDSVVPKLGPKCRKKVHLITSDQHRNSVVSQLKLVLNGGIDQYGATVKPDNKGSVCIISHECFMRIPFGYDSNDLPVFPNRDKIKVIFDEARKCVMSDFSVELPINTLRKLAKIIPNIGREMSRASDPSYGLDIPEGAEDNERYIHLEVERFDNAEFDSIFAGNRYLRTKVRERLRRVLSTAYGKSVRVYASMNRREDTMHMALHLVLVPANLFFGWKSVILLSAFFEHSQMYHLLDTMSRRNRQYSRRRIQAPSVELERVDNLVNPEREAKMREHYKKASVTYIFNDTQLTSNKLRNGVPVATTGFDEQQFVEDFHKLLRTRKHNLTTKARELTLRGAIQMMQDAETGRIKPTKYDKRLFRLLRTLPAADLATSPVAFMASAARFLSERWQEKHEYPVRPLPICMNVDPSYTRDVEAEIGDPNEVSGNWVKVPFAAHGLNTFKTYNTIAFLACVNARPAVVSYMAHVAPTYRPKLDHTLDQAIQVLTRSCVRDLNSKEAPLLIVTDKELAQSIALHLGVKLVHPESLGFTQTWKSLTVPRLSDERSAKQKREYWKKNSKRLLENRKTVYQNTKNTVLSKEKFLRDNNPEYRRVNSIRARISQLRRADPEGFSQTEQFIKLQEELDALLGPVREKNKVLAEQWKLQYINTQCTAEQKT